MDGPLAHIAGMPVVRIIVTVGAIPVALMDVCAAALLHPLQEMRVRRARREARKLRALKRLIRTIEVCQRNGLARPLH